MSSSFIIAATSDEQRAFIPAVWGLAAGVIASQTDLELNLVVSLSAGRFTFPRSGKVIGIVREQGGTSISAGTLTMKIVKNGTNSSSTAVVSSGSRGASYFSTITNFAAGDSMHVRIDTNGSYVGAALIHTYPLVVYD